VSDDNETVLVVPGASSTNVVHLSRSCHAIRLSSREVREVPRETVASWRTCDRCTGDVDAAEYDFGYQEELKEAAND
jgi:hypothetical protein